MEQQARETAFMGALTTEHFVLQSAASTTVSESGTRATLYVMALSSSLVALGFATGTKQAFAPFVATVLPAVFLLGLFTMVRLVEIGVQNLVLQDSIVRIRRYYRELVPEAPAYFDDGVTGGKHGDGQDHDQGQGQDESRVALGMIGIRRRSGLLTGLGTMAAMVAAINSIVGGAGVALLAARLLGGDRTALGVLIGALAALAVMALFLTYQNSRYRALFPAARGRRER